MSRLICQFCHAQCRALSAIKAQCTLITLNSNTLNESIQIYDHRRVSAEIANGLPLIWSGAICRDGERKSVIIPSILEAGSTCTLSRNSHCLMWSGGSSPRAFQCCPGGRWVWLACSLLGLRGWPEIKFEFRWSITSHLTLKDFSKLYSCVTL